VDSEYKIIEINPRTSLQNTLAGACGADVAYTAYLDAGGQAAKPSLSFRNNVLWADDFFDTVSLLQHLARRDISRREVIDSLNPGKVRSVAAWDDLLPLAFRALTLSQRAFRLILSKLNPRFVSKS
jgi:predicted ATP-grasp superfamily ATP-dependent carboligase